MNDGGPHLPPPVTGPPTMPPASAGPSASQGTPPPPGTPPPSSGGDGGNSSGSGNSWWKEWWWAFALAAVAAIAIAVVLVLDKSGDDQASPAPTQVATTTTVDEGVASTPPPSTDPIAPTPTDTATSEVPESTEAPTTTSAPSSNEIDGAPAGQKGDRESPVPAGSIADIGDGWRLQVLEVTTDATDAVLAEDQFNDPPPSGSRYTLVTVALGFFGRDDPQPALFADIAAVGADGDDLDDYCGVTPDQLDIFLDVFAGAVQTGTLCFVTSPADDGELQLRASADFGATNVFLDVSSAPASAEPMKALTRPQPGAAATAARKPPTPIGTEIDLGDGWSLTVISPAADITDHVLDSDESNDPPPDGYWFVGVEVELAYDGDGDGEMYDVGIGAVGDSNLQLDQQCGALDGELEQFGDLGAGDSTSGFMCFVAAESDAGTIALYATAGFGTDDATFFATD